MVLGPPDRWSGGRPYCTQVPQALGNVRDEAKMVYQKARPRHSEMIGFFVDDDQLTCLPDFGYLFFNQLA